MRQSEGKGSDSHEAERTVKGLLRRPTGGSPPVNHRSILADGMVPMIRIMPAVAVVIIVPTILAILTSPTRRAATAIPIRKQDAHLGTTLRSALPSPLIVAATTNRHHRRRHHPPATGDADGPAEAATGPNTAAAARTIAERSKRRKEAAIIVGMLISRDPIIPATNHLAMSTIARDQRVTVPMRISTITSDARQAGRGTVSPTGAPTRAPTGEANG